MIDAFKDTFKIADLRRKIGITIFLISVYRLGCYIPSPGINGQALASFFENFPNTLFQLVDLFAGGALRNATIFALGIMPYISISIILELLSSIIPYFENLVRGGLKEGENLLN